MREYRSASRARFERSYALPEQILPRHILDRDVPRAEALRELVGFGSAAVAEIADTETIERGKRHRASLSLQVAAAAHLAGDTKLRDHALENFASHVRNNTLYDPNPAVAE